MKTKLKISLVGGCMLLFSTGAVMASDAGLINGAGTLPQGDFAVSLNGGLDMPEPLLASLALDYGVTEKIQFGVDATFAGLVWGTGLRSAFTVWNSEDQSHFIAFRIAPHFTYINAIIADLKMFSVDPHFAYEYRWGEKKGGIFVKAGTQHYRINFGSKVFETFFDSSDANATVYSHFVRGSVGVQQMIGEIFSMTLEVGYLKGVQNGGSSPVGKLGLTWAW